MRRVAAQEWLQQGVGIGRSDGPVLLGLTVTYVT
jgi:hypothetical protein